MSEQFWDSVDRRLGLQERYVLTDAERQQIHEKEVEAYKANLAEMQRIMNSHRGELDKRGFHTELQCNEDGLLFRYSRQGYYGPGGFRSDPHIDGPLVLSELNPAGDPNTYIRDNDIEKNAEVGTGFDPELFEQFVRRNLDRFLEPGNLIITDSRRDQIRAAQRTE